jgi:hypothetical protein
LVDHSLPPLRLHDFLTEFRRNIDDVKLDAKDFRRLSKPAGNRFVGFSAGEGDDCSSLLLAPVILEKGQLQNVLGDLSSAAPLSIGPAGHTPPPRCSGRRCSVQLDSDTASQSDWHRVMAGP